MNNETIGIDAGGSLIKIVYEDKGKLHYRKYPVADLHQVMTWVKMFTVDKQVMLTGGKAGGIRSNYFPEAVIVDEFTASCQGAKYLMQKENIRGTEKFLLINIGTGTSWFLVEEDRYERVLGSGMGGGTFMGLGNILSGSQDFMELVEMSGTGSRGNVDLLVKDIYHPEEPPIPGELTASNFAKGTEESTKSDRMAAFLNMIAETMTLLTVQAATIHSAKSAVFIGCTISGNKPLQDYLKYYLNMSGLEPVFLPNGEFSGALGAKMF